MTKKDADILIAKLPRMNYQELVTLWAQLFGTHCYTRGREFLIRRITWRLRNQFLGGLTDRAQGRAQLLCDEALIRFQPKRYKYGENMERSRKGALKVIKKEYKGTLHEVLILDEGRYAYNQEIYDNLTSIAWKIAGYKISGNKFFNLPPKTRTPSA